MSQLIDTVEAHNEDHMRFAPPRLTTLECLEDRALLSANFGIPWPDPGHLTISFTPDGTDTPKGASTLSSLLRAAGSDAAWQREILRAFQTWAVNANINIGLVADGGQALGTPGAVQGDSRFGDVRVAAARLADNEVAASQPFSWTGTTYGGDFLFNNRAAFGVGNNANAYDILSVALHEAGHVFGLDHSDTAGSVLNEEYGFHPNLSAEDVARFQAMYGTRTADSFDAKKSNDTLANATSLLPQVVGAGLRYSADADITTLNDVDHYKFTTASAILVPTVVTVRLQTEGLSLLTAKVSVLDSNGNVVASGATLDPMNNDLTLSFKTSKLLGTYYVRVEGATNDVFGIGGYRVSVDTMLLGGLLPPLEPINLPLTVKDGLLNNVLSLATALLPVSTQSPDSRFDATYRGQIESTKDTDFYQIRAPHAAGADPMNLNVIVWGQGQNALNPRIRVYDGAGNQIGFQVLANDAGLMSIQVQHVKPGGNYYIQVSGRAGAANNTGDYFLGADFNNTPAAEPDGIASGGLTSTDPTDTGSLTVKNGGLYQFFLAADPMTGAGGVVTMTVTDSTGKVVLTLRASSDQPPVTGVCHLDIGTYTIRYTATAATGKTLDPVGYDVYLLQLSDPVGPYATRTANTAPSNTDTTSSSSQYSYAGASSSPPPKSVPYSF